MADKYEQAKTEFAAWLALTPAERSRLGLPASQAAFARNKGVTDRVLRKWANEPDVQAKVEELRAERVVPMVQAGSTPPPQSSAEEDYETARRVLVEKVAAGDNPAWAKLYFDVYGRAFSAQETAASSANLADLDDEQLAEQVLGMLETDVIARHLLARGWTP